MAAAVATRSIAGTLNSKELVDIVDRDNNVLRTVPRAEMRANALAHRATFVFVTNSRGQLAVQARRGGGLQRPGV